MARKVTKAKKPPIVSALPRSELFALVDRMKTPGNLARVAGIPWPRFRSYAEGAPVPPDVAEILRAAPATPAAWGSGLVVSVRSRPGPLGARRTGRGRRGRHPPPPGPEVDVTLVAGRDRSLSIRREDVSRLAGIPVADLRLVVWADSAPLGAPVSPEAASLRLVPVPPLVPIEDLLDVREGSPTFRDRDRFWPLTDELWRAAEARGGVLWISQVKRGRGGLYEVWRWGHDPRRLRPQPSRLAGWTA